MKRINITCESCHVTHSVPKTSEIPAHVVSMGCNWCPRCEDTAQDYYKEWYNENDDKEPEPIIPDNQLCLPFILEEIGKNKPLTLINHERQRRENGGGVFY